jgi:hypothetical protein
MPECRKIEQIFIKYTNIFHCQTLQNLSKIDIFGRKVYHLATLEQSDVSGQAKLLRV